MIEKKKMFPPTSTSELRVGGRTSPKKRRGREGGIPSGRKEENKNEVTPGKRETRPRAGDRLFALAEETIQVTDITKKKKRTSSPGKVDRRSRSQPFSKERKNDRGLKRNVWGTSGK